MKISKAVILCGGLGTRFLPITKSVPKEILPIIDTPVVSYIVDEAIESGITDILIVLGKGKDAIKDYFLPNARLENALKRAGKEDLYNSYFCRKANISFVMQDSPLGSGDAVLRSEPFAGKNDFCLALGDDLIHGETPAMRQLANVHNGVVTVGVQCINNESICKYGVAKLKGKERGGLMQCEAFIEKPAPSELPSNYAALGRYVVSNAIFNELKATMPQDGELRLTDAINSLCKKSNVFAYEFEGKRYDSGDKLSYIKATIEYGLRREFGAELKEYLKNLVKQN